MSVKGKARGPEAWWTTRRRKFLDGVLKGMGQTDAARYAEYKRPNVEGSKLMRHPRMRERLAEYAEMRRQATQNALNEEPLEAVITRREVEQNLAEILKTKGSGGARVSAAMALSRINGWIVNKTDNVTDRLKGKSQEELEFIAIYGRDPADASELQAFRDIRSREKGEEPSETS